MKNMTQAVNDWYNNELRNTEEMKHRIAYFERGFADGSVGYYDRWYEDKKDFSAYKDGVLAGRKAYKGDHFHTVGSAYA